MTPDGTATPLIETNGLYFLEGVDPEEIIEKKFTKLETHATNVAKMATRRTEFAFLQSSTEVSRIIGKRQKEFSKRSAGYKPRINAQKH